MRVTEDPSGRLQTDWVGHEYETPPQRRPGSILTGRLKRQDGQEITVTRMQWTIGALPIGAFVSVAECGDSENSFAIENKTAWQRTLVITSGVLVNLTLPVFALGAASITAASITQHHVREVRTGSAAANAGLEPGDLIVEVAGRRTWRQDPASVLEQEARRRDTDVTWRRADQRETGTVRRIELIEDTGLITEGRTDWRRVGSALANAPQSAVTNTADIYSLIAAELKTWIGGNSERPLGGPVRAVRETGEVIQHGRVTGWLIGVAIISVNVGIVNLLPIMPLDGGRLLLLAIEKKRGRRMRPQTERAISYVGMAAIIGLTMTLIAKDLMDALN